jgi:hypothetical protein
MAAFWRAIHGWSGVGALAAAAACLLVVALAIRPRQATPTAKVEPPKQEERGGAPAAPAPAGRVIRDGSRAITLSADGSVAGLDGLPDRFRGAVEQALATRRVSAPAALAELAAKRSVLLGPSAPSARVDLLQPIGSMVETQRPVFRWRAVAGAEYQVGVYDSEFQQVAQSGWIRVPEWQSSTELRRGVRYLWQLTVRRDGSEFTVPEPPAPEARFAILDAASEADLVRLRGTWSDSHLVMGVAYAQAGLLSEAQRELQAVADQNPDAATIAALLASVTAPSVNSVPRRSK